MTDTATLAAKEFDGCLRIGVNVNGDWHVVGNVEPGNVDIENVAPRCWRVTLTARWLENQD